MNHRPIYFPGRTLTARGLTAEQRWRDASDKRHEDLAHPDQQAVGASIENTTGDVRLVLDLLADNTRRLLVRVGERLRLLVHPPGRPVDVEMPGPVASQGLSAQRLMMSKPLSGDMPKAPFVLSYQVPEDADVESERPSGLVIQLAAPREDGSTSGLVIGRAVPDQFAPQLTVESGRRLRIRGKLRVAEPGRLIEKPPAPPGAAEAPSDDEITKAWLRTPAGAAERERIIAQFDETFEAEIQNQKRVGGQLEYRLTVRNQGPEPVRELRLYQGLQPDDEKQSPNWQAVPMPSGITLEPGETFALAVTFDLPTDRSKTDRLAVHAAGLITYDLTITAHQLAAIT